MFDTTHLIIKFEFRNVENESIDKIFLDCVMFIISHLWPGKHDAYSNKKGQCHKIDIYCNNAIKIKIFEEWLRPYPH